MPRIPFEEKTNEERTRTEKEKTFTEKESIINYLSMMRAQTRDYSLKYDLNQCIQIIEGKENQHVNELREAVNDLATENEQLTHRCDQLALELSARVQSPN
ncbi:hypothetical protein NEDG_01867 [Nematocida displodere]|uniref:Uncharacterized protein n=1 Tax=Nematocida displodere TaxID=1805483 RepID=A0A177EGK5_9MICR|nr:hypothetical protein NEDG_01867 [Nematocida displodere]